MSLQETLDARKARLLALRQRKEGLADGESLVKNRNFDPNSRTLKKHTRDDDEMMENTVQKNVEGLAEDIIKQDEQTRAEDLNIFNIAPKRVNWDLKRETQKKLDKLEGRTRNAIHVLIRQRLAAAKGESDDIVGAMKAQEAQDAKDSDEEED